MSFWLVSKSQVRGEYPDFEPYIIMPEYNDQDWSAITTKRQIKHRLQLQDEDMPPETMELIVQTLWRFLFHIQKDDIICVVEVEETKLKAVYFANVSADVVYEPRVKEHRLPVTWYKEKAGKARLWKYRLNLLNADAWPRPLDNKKVTSALSSYLPLPGNRFVKWIWLILILFIVAKLSRMTMRMFES